MFSGDTFKRFLRTLGAAPTTSAHLGFITGAPLSFVPNISVTVANSPYNEGPFTFSTPGVWIVNYYINGTSSSNPTGSVQIYSTASGAGNELIGASTAPLQQTTASGTSGNIFAGGSFVATITSTVIYDVFINILIGSIQMSRSTCYVNFTRIG